MATDAQVVTTVKNDLTWLQQHERLIIIFMVLLAAGWLGNHWLNNSAIEAQTAYGVAQKASEQAQLQAAQAASQYQATIDALTRQNNALAASVAQRNAILAQTQTQIKAEPMPAVITEWSRLIGDKYPIYPVEGSSDLVGVTADGARATVAQLEEVPVLSANLVDTQKIVTNQKDELAKADTLVVSLKNQISKDDATCTAQVAAVKAVSRRSKRDWFIAGFLAGIGTRILGKF